MKKCLLDNGIKLLYKRTESSLTSFCIGFKAGADREGKGEIGVAHAVEHMVSKQTKTRTEDEINKKCDELFAFDNAMTNFPYVIYYGVCENEDFNEGFNLYSDMVINPTFNYGLEEELKVICTESREWQEDMDQYCEDELFHNAFNIRRMKDIIIGSEEDVKKINREKMVDFYNKYYTANNCTISVVSSMDFETVKNIVSENTKNLKSGTKVNSNNNYEFSNDSFFEKKVEGFTGAKIQYCFDISFLNETQIEALRIFNEFFGEGVSSVLFNALRTKKGLVYNTSSSIKNESGIKLFTINASTSKEKVYEAKKIIDNLISDVIQGNLQVEKEDVIKLYKRIIRKRKMKVEKGIIMAVYLTTYSIMYNNDDLFLNELEGMNILNEDVNKIAESVFNKFAVQIIQ